MNLEHPSLALLGKRLIEVSAPVFMAASRFASGTEKGFPGSPEAILMGLSALD